MTSTYEAVAENLAAEFARVHPAETVIRCVVAARDGAEQALGGASPDLVERVARKHLELLALVATGRDLTR